MFLPSAFKSVSGPRSPRNFEQWPTPIVGIEPIGGQKRTQMCGTRPSHRREHHRRRTDTAPFDRSGAILGTEQSIYGAATGVVR
jgi:hypothetical protein